MFLTSLIPTIVRYSCVALVPRTIAFGVIGLLFVGLLSHAQAPSNVTLTWNPSISPGIAGYRLYYGTSSGSYPQIINVGNTTTITVPNLAAGQTYYFVVTAYNTLGIESAPSNQTSVTVSANQFPAVTPVSSPPDFSGNGQSDLLWRNKYTGEIGVWIMNGNSVNETVVVGSVSIAWQIIGVADLNGNGRSDIVWYGGNGNYGVWFMNGTSVTGTSGFTLPADFPVLAFADFDGDGLQDIVGWNSSSGAILIAKNNGSLGFTTQWSSTVPTDWVLIGLADFDGDGRHELIWRDQTNGTVAAWLFSQSQPFVPSQVVVFGSVTLDWSIKGIGKADSTSAQGLIWQNAQSGQVGLWKLNTNGQVASTGLGAAGVPWKLVGAPYFDGFSGNPEILWVDTQGGTVAVWRASGTNIAPSVLGNPGTNWTIQPTAN
jgi:hypothetical protein